MTNLKKYFPLAFNKKKDLVEMLVSVLIQVGASAIIGFVISLLSGLPLIGWIIGILGGVVGLYFVVSVILTVLDYFGAFKK